MAEFTALALQPGRPCTTPGTPATPSGNGHGCCGGSAGKYALGVPALLGWTVWICGFTVPTIALTVFQVLHACETQGTNYVLPVASATSKSALILASVASCGGYLWVAARMARPRELHLHGLVLLLILPENLGNQVNDTLVLSQMPGVWLLDILKYVPWGVRRVLFVHLVVSKISALGPPDPGCQGIHTWGRLLKVNIALLASMGALYSLWLNVVRLRGVDEEVLNSRFSFELHPGMTVADLVILRGCLFTGFIVALTMQGLNVIFVCRCRRLIRTAEMKLVARAVDGEVMRRVRWKLRRHFLAICLSLLTTYLTVAAGLLDVTNVLGEDLENTIALYCHMIDILGDVWSILLLSGIGLLLHREDPEAGDISARIRNLLHSAVLTGRLDVASDGAVFENASNVCVVSFPGKFLEEWRSLTWQCEQHLLSCACVFLPKTDPQNRYGKHVKCPETPGRCWCFSLYGYETPWGCAWFHAWKSNVEEAVELGLDLVVTFFPGQAGKGVVSWDSLATSDLWDGVGLGGSQKGEVAFLRKQGYKFAEEDLEATRLRLNGCQV